MPVPPVGVDIASVARESLHNMKTLNVLDTKIPRKADDQGIYEWTWAPDDAVKLRFGKEGYANVETSITADDSEQAVTLYPRLRFPERLSTRQPTGRSTHSPPYQ